MAIPAEVERRARWVLDTIGATELGLGDDVPYDEGAWEKVYRRERPSGDDLAAAFFDLARLEELSARRDDHGRFLAADSSLDPLDPPLERLRRELGVEQRRWGGARFAVALSHDVDIPWRWTRRAALGSAARLKGAVFHGRWKAASREARALATLPLHKLRGSDPYWNFEKITAGIRKRGSSTTFFVMADQRLPDDGPSPELYDRLRPRLVETLLETGAEVGLHGSYSAAIEVAQLELEAERLRALAPDASGQRFHYLSLDPHRHPSALEKLGFAYDSSLAFPDRPGFRAGIAQPFRPWDLEQECPLDLVEIPLAVMDATLAEDHYLGLTPRRAWPLLRGLLDWTEENGGAFSVLWHPGSFDPASSPGWGRLFYRFLDAVRERGGVCTSCGELAAEARSRLSSDRPRI
jgi:peptidoglycan/xylan/chitin deacetylase (PgdA/CDA1 family)